MRAAAWSIALCGCWSSAAPPPPPAGPPLRAPAAPVLREPRAIELGAFDEDGALHPADEIPLFAGSSFGWRIDLGCTGEVSVLEELRLPAPGDWGSDPDLTITANGRRAQVRSTLPCVDGWIEKAWSVSPNDPAGVWVLRISVEGFEPQTLRATFAPVPPATGP